MTENGLHISEERAPGAARGDLRLERLPGEAGPLVRCTGELTGETAPELDVELRRLEPMGHTAITVDLSHCRFLDVDGLLALLDADRRLRSRGSRLVLVVGIGNLARQLRLLGIDWAIALFPRDTVAAGALRGGAPPRDAPPTWEEARARTLARWRLIEETLQEDPEEALRQMTSMFAICDLAERLFQEREGPAHARCQFCPLFYALGGKPEDFGCRSVLDPLVGAIRAGDLEGARARIAALRTAIAEMGVPPGGTAPPLSWPWLAPGTFSPAASGSGEALSPPERGSPARAAG